MNLVHSFILKDSIITERGFVQLACFVLSCLYAKRSGFNINLHCDKKSEKLLNFAPYDNIILDLEGFEKPTDHRLFAYSKFKSMENEPLGSIHIDGDVFLKDSLLIDSLNFDNYDCIIQNTEAPHTYSNNIEDTSNYWLNTQLCLCNCDYPVWANRELKKMYNCGIIGINNLELKQEYFKTYWDFIKQCCKFKQGHVTPELVIEQQFLTDLCESHNYKVKELLTGDIFENAVKIKYQHLLGDSKFVNLDNILKTIKNISEVCYNKLMNNKP